MTPKKLWKTTIEIWTEFNPAGMPLDCLAQEAISGDAYCGKKEIEAIEDVARFPDTDFFG